MSLVQIIGDLLTTIDTTLSRADFRSSDPNWQQLYALRKHLDDQQRTLVTLSINPADSGYKSLTEQISTANDQIAAVINDPSRVGDVIHQTARIAALVDNILEYVEPRPEDK